MRARAIVAIGMGLAALTCAEAARATDPFEIQVYDGTANAPLQPGLELHLNYVANGLKDPEGTVVARHHQGHMTLEPSLGITDFWELGAYFQTAIVPGAGFEYAGAKLRSKFVTPPKWHPNLRLGANFELALIPGRFDGDRWSTELRPIVAWENASWLFALNANVSTPLAGDGFRDGPAFEPAAMAVAKIRDTIGLGVEYYSGLGPFSSFLPVSQQEHYVYEVVDLLAIDELELNVGVGEGLTSGSNKLVCKIIVGWAWGTSAPGSPTQPSPTSRLGGGPRGAFLRRLPGQSPLL